MLRCFKQCFKYYKLYMSDLQTLDKQDIDSTQLIDYHKINPDSNSVLIGD